MLIELNDPKGKDLIFVRCGLEEQRHAEVLYKAYCRYTRDYEKSRAIWSGYCALKRTYEESARHAKTRGQLLFFFPGTTVLRQAVPA